MGDFEDLGKFWLGYQNLASIEFQHLNYTKTDFFQVRVKALDSMNRRL